MIREHASLLSLIVLAVAMLPAMARADDCPPLDTDICVSTAQGEFHAATEAEATKLADSARWAAQAFEHYFQHPAVRGAVVSTSSVSAVQTQALQERGATWVLPWISPQDKRRLAESQVRRQVEAQLGDNTDPAQVEAAVAQALAKLPNGDNGTAGSALRHEIGHQLLIHAFPVAHGNDPDTDNAHGYGGGLPDWLDETAAVLMEDAAMTTRRREALQRMLTCGKRERLPPLAGFFTMDHPLAGVVRKQFAGMDNDAPTGGTRLLMVSGEQGRELGKRGLDFYLQSRGFADFLIEASGDATIFAGIARSLAIGGDMRSWLADEGTRHGLPDNLAGLETAWQAWLDLTVAAAPACSPPKPDA